ncbi:MAG TPA: hypothetical protein VH417_12525 [Vicinamibacterales bacterium]|jgi:hypothetical protein
MTWTIGRFGGGLLAALVAAAAVWQAADSRAQQAAPQATPSQPPPRSLQMGGKKSVMTFFITSHGPGKGGDLGGLRGADAHCQALAKAEGAGDHTWRAYLSTAAGSQPAVNARDRIGSGPWYNGEGNRIALNPGELHGGMNAIDKENAVTERIDPVNGVGDTPNRHDILTGSRADGTAFPAGTDLTCNNWTSSGAGRAQVGHHDRQGQGEGSTSWNSAHASRGCGQADLEATGGAGLFYCFAID